MASKPNSLSGVFPLLAVLMLLPVSVVASTDAAEGTPTDSDYMLLRVCEGVVRLFEIEPAAVWPGYSLAEQPFLVYAPERWVLLYNSARPVKGFGACPRSWPNLGPGVRYHEGRYDDLAGELEFNVALGDTAVVAIGFPDGFAGRLEHPEVEAFSYIVHEAFHQYQHASFGEIPWAREEKYPISDLNNGALAWLEMRVLRDALEAVRAGDRERCRGVVETFLAVRHHRWKGGDPFIRQYEQGKELEEGTAKYVELKCVELMHGVTYVSTIDGASSPLAGAFPDTAMTDLLYRELRERMGEACLQPEDIPRNRIYAVAATEGFLLDYFGVDWKGLAQEAGPGFTYADLLGTRLGVEEGSLADLVDRAKREYDFETTLAAATRAAQDYEHAYASELEAFEAQAGARLELVVSSSGLSRSRVSTAKKWIMDSGRYSLCDNFKVYTLRGRDWSFELHDAGLLEINDWDAQRKTVVIYDAGIDSVSFDGKPAIGLRAGERDFESLELAGDRFTLRGTHSGTFVVTGDTVRVLLGPASARPR
jgi:hypothetical protein